MAPLKALLASLTFGLACSVTSAAPICDFCNDIVYNETVECPYVPGMRNFSVHRHLGEWTVAEHFDAPFLFGLTCVYFEFVYQHSREFLVKIVGLRDVNEDNIRMWRNEEIIMTYTCFFNDTDPAVMTILHTNETALEYLPTYVVVDTDYSTYSVLYSCFQPLFQEKKIEFLWVLLRRGQRYPTKKIREIKSRLQKLGINTKALLQSHSYKCHSSSYRWFW